MLKNSARNCALAFSPSFMFFKTEKSKSRYPGPTTMLRPASPNVSGWLSTNAEVLNHLLNRVWAGVGIANQVGPVIA
jgi:hypothetical protein